MIFIKNKKAWKEFVKANDEDLVDTPKEYPCALEIENTFREGFQYKVTYKQDLESMIQKIDSGREF